MLRNGVAYRGVLNRPARGSIPRFMRFWGKSASRARGVQHPAARMMSLHWIVFEVLELSVDSS